MIVTMPPVPPAAPVAQTAPNPAGRSGPASRRFGTDGGTNRETDPRKTAEPTEKPTAAAERRRRAEQPGPSREFAVGLVGSLKGAHKYALHSPDGVAFNLPNAQATMKVGTYRPAVRGLRAVWVRNLPGGGTHLRFFYAKSRPAPEVRLRADGVRVVAR